MLNNFFLILLLVLITACSFDYKEAMISEELEGGTPNAVIINLSETVIRKGKISYCFEAERAEAFEKRNLTIFTNIQFSEYDKTGKIATEGEVGLAHYYSDTENIIFERNFRIASLQQGYFIKGESIFWVGDTRTLRSDLEKEIIMGKDNGSYITGTGFSARASDNSFNFEGGVRGVYVSENEE